MVEGEVGIGKSRLLDDWAHWVAAEGGTVLRAHSLEEKIEVTAAFFEARSQ